MMLVRQSILFSVCSLAFLLGSFCAAAENPSADVAVQQDNDVSSSNDEVFKPRYIIESIEVRGNDITETDLILSYLDFKKGDLLDQQAVELSRIRLIALGYFKDVRMSLERGSKRGMVKLIVDVDERWTIIIDDIFLGLSETNPFWGGLGVSDINFMGLGMVLSGAFVASEHQVAGRVGAYWPSVMGTDYSAGIMGFGAHAREISLSKNIGSPSEGVDGCNFDEDQALDYWRAGVVATFGFRLGRENRLNFQLHGEHIEADHFVDPVDSQGNKCKNYPFLGYLRPAGSTLMSFSAQFERDTRDDFFLPSQGIHLLIGVELASKAILFSDYEYSKYTIQYEQYFNPYLDHVWRLKMAGGLLQDVGERGSPYFVRFFIGDYARFQIDKSSLARNLDLNFSTTTDYGDLLFSAEFEYDIPLWTGGRFFHRGYAYAALNFSAITKARFLASKDEWSGRTKRPVTFDLGLKFETPIGLLTFSAGYIADLFVD